MKKAILFLLLLANITPAYAEDVAAWVKVDLNGNQISQAIACTPSVCGDTNSEYAKATLKPGEQYVIQNKATKEGNVAGISPSSDIQIKVDLKTNQFTVVRTNEITPVVKKEVAPVSSTEPSIVTYEPVTTMKVKTTTVETFNPITEQPVTVVEKKAVIEPAINEPVNNWWDQWFIDLAALQEWFKTFFESWLLP
jgi:hypothetical protein